jgi:hypothetical protein
MTSIDDNGFPIGFKTSAGARISPLANGVPGDDDVVAEVRHVGHHQKEAVVEEGRGGPKWRLASDEGVHLKGTDLAPFPLGYYNAGLQADLAGSIARLASARGIRLERVAMTLTTAYSLTGSFVQGTGQGVAEGVTVELDIATGSAADTIAALTRDAVVASPALAMVTTAIDNTFALYVNGRRRNPTTLPASAAPNAEDPFIKYRDLPRPLASAGDQSRLVVKTGESQAGEPVLAPVSGKVVREVKGRGELIDPRGIYRTKVALNLPGSSLFEFTCDETGSATAPTGLALATAGIAFCYITQISRYIENMKLPIRGVRLVQVSPFGIAGDGRGAASPCDTHLFLNGETDDDTFEMLQRVSANTCYLHQTMIQMPPLRVALKVNGAAVAI